MVGWLSPGIGSECANFGSFVVEQTCKKTQRDVAHEVFLAWPVGAICRLPPGDELPYAQAVQHLLGEGGFFPAGVPGDPAYCWGVVRQVVGGHPSHIAVQQLI
jgi:hypothetical protein